MNTRPITEYAGMDIRYGDVEDFRDLWTNIGYDPKAIAEFNATDPEWIKRFLTTIREKFGETQYANWARLCYTHPQIEEWLAKYLTEEQPINEEVTNRLKQLDPAYLTESTLEKLKNNFKFWETEWKNNGQNETEIPTILHTIFQKFLANTNYQVGPELTSQWL